MKQSPGPTLIRALTKFRDDLKAGRGLDHLKQS